MLECTICGLLSLNSRSCPACGSQNLIDLTEQEDDPSMPTEVPGLDDAVNSLHELEGTEKTEGDDIIESVKSNNSSTTSDSFGALLTISLVIPVISAIISEMGIIGFISVEYLCDGLPSLNKIAATSIGRSVSTCRPVVSKSNAMKESNLRQESRSA